MSTPQAEATPGRAAAPRLAVLVILVALAAVAGCNDSDPVAVTEPIPCTTEYVAGLRIEIRDAVTGEPAACGASVWITDGDYAEDGYDLCAQSARLIEPEYVLGAFERPGEYTISVKQAGFEPWSATGVLVTADECHVQTVVVKANLKRD